MTWLDWAIVIGLNGAIIAYGLHLARGTRGSADFFLAGRQLPWWIVGVSMYATAIDSSDLIADTGGTYTLGLSYFVVNWLGVIGGWALGAFFIFPPMYRAGMYTNAEYLEARFGVAARVISVFVQVQYRTLVLAIIGKTVYLMLSIVCGWGPEAWWAVVAIAVLAALYTSFGGLRSVVVTDGLQFIVMAATALVFWVIIWNHVGGWSGIEARLAAVDADLPAQMLHIGEDRIDREDVSAASSETVQRKLLLGGEYDPVDQVIVRRTPAGLVVLAFVIVGVAYSVVNHTQSMRMFAARSEWDLKMSAVVAGGIMLVFAFVNLSMGVMGRALYPDVSALPGGLTDAIYPHLMRQIGAVGLNGFLVAGVMAASLSTYDSIGSTLSALLTRDVYARLIVKNGTDRHYLWVGRGLTILVIGGSFAYVPFLEGGMLLFYLDLTSAFVVPLLTLYLMGTATRVHRKAGLVGLLAGTVYGMVRLVAPTIAARYGVRILPVLLLDSSGAYLYSLLLTAGVMIGVSLWIGWAPRGALFRTEADGWLRATQLEVRSQSSSRGAMRSATLPAVLAALVVAAGAVLSFVVFW